ncbi:Pimeloyl-ACP methyl ester carboxylesterase [Abditibacterium utsteinense]|uniref:Pimeloyl-ACP methyl ester carboxylesterase n=1 Tax=Abditibacterium utsteinense TaxID=1960156 RepID=A0A2S8SPS6_9BACT|nr:alpha/beta hydrolase [Abditibacterium utsteinense]PQV62784.1 Pimeloyl-ACP methyl ester carboxylesterase [Abditibacterium utsteinense]
MQIFFLPYFGGNAHSWREVIALLPEFECTAFSLARIGEKDGVYSVQNAVEEIETLLLSSASGEFVLVGHSMGGKFALGVAAKGADDLKALVLVAPSPPTPEPIPDEVRARMLESHGTREAALVTIRGASQREISGETLENAIRANLETSKSDWKNWLQTGSYQDISSVLPEIKIPVLVVIGDADTGMTRELMQSEIVSKVAGAHLEIIENAGHLLPLEAPAELAQKIRDFTKNESLS